MDQASRRHTDDILGDIREIFEKEPHSLVLISRESREELERKYGRPVECWNLERGFCSIGKGVESFRRVENETILDLVGLEYITQNIYGVVFYYYLDEEQNRGRTFVCHDDRTAKIIYLQ